MAHSKALLKLLTCSCLVVFATSPQAFAQDATDATDTMSELELELEAMDTVIEDAAEASGDDIQMLLPEDESVAEDITIESEALDVGDTPVVEENAVIEIEQVETAPDQPAQATLDEPAPEPASPQTGAAMDNTAAVLQPAQEFDENLFFDAEALVPESSLARDAAPSKVNPTLNPGSRLVITTKSAGANSHAARLTAAERAIKLGRYESALGIYDQFLAAHKRDPNALLGRAIALQKLGRNDEAINAYDKLLDVKPRNLEAQVNLQGLMAQRYPAVALRNLQELYQQHPENVGIIAQLSVVEAQLGNYNDAIRYLGMAASMEPQNATHLFNMAVIADRAGEREQAIRYYEEALETDTLYSSGKAIPRESVFQRLADLR